MKILQITDLHITPGPTLRGVDTTAALASVLAHARLHPADAIIATGDLTEHGDADSYQRLRGMLLEMGCPVYAIPGNHDRIDALQTHLLGGPIKGPGSHDLDPTWRLLALDSSAPDRAWGRLTSTDTDLLEPSDRPTLVAIHHGPRAHCHSHKCRLQNEQDLLSRLPAAGARAVIAGHLHHASDETVASVRLLCTPATCIQVQHPTTGHEPVPGHGYRTLDLHADGTLDTQVHHLPT